ncbi:MAG TPA: GNAT family N-acetyltransferase [Acidimicrobiales bacterium]|nr:GNAT family N-acetyltransferase [Acidimicrobiales bacterium]
MSEVRSASPGEAGRLAGVLARAFSDDPLVGYLFPDVARRMQRLRRFFEIQLSHNYFVRGEVLTDADRHACALWLPPAARPPRLSDVLAQASMPFVLGSRFGAARRVANLLATRHPEPPHWYLGPIGTEPNHQRQGLGAALISQVLRRCDSEGLPAYLESSNEKNLALYVRLGFAVIEELEVPPDGPRLWLMWRTPRPEGYLDRGWEA